jgi:hypothetical protein
MKKGFLATAVVAFAWFALSCATVEAHTRSRSLTVSVEDRAAVTDCSQVEIRYDDGETARGEEQFAAAKSAVPSLDVAAPENGGMTVQGWDRDEYSIKACKAAGAGSAFGAQELLRQVSVSFQGGHLTATGPSEEDAWVVYFIVHVPEGAAMSLESHNGEISVRNVSGKVTARSHNGPIVLGDCSGELQARTENGPISVKNSTGKIDAQAQNGPIDFSGSGQNVHLESQNGPLKISLAGTRWEGGDLEARTENGPLTLDLPRNYASGVRVEATGYSPFVCRAPACDQARGTWAETHRGIQFGNEAPVVRMSTVNGPVKIESKSTAE